MKYHYIKASSFKVNLLGILTTFLLFTVLIYAQNDSSGHNDNMLPPDAVKPTDPWITSNIITIPDLVGRLNDKKKNAPTIIQIGFKSLYEDARIPGSMFAGPGESDDGLQLLKLKTKKMKKNSNIVLYCGCCMWDECPNIRGAFKEMKALGFSNVKALYIPNSFNADWIDKGYPVKKGSTN
jgi:thiosulfate/3-mercaptopyruvate sulfurtransferase